MTSESNKFDLDAVLRNGEREYCDVIAEVGRPFSDSVAWWSTSVATKNLSESNLWHHVAIGDPPPVISWLPLLKRFVSRLYRIFLLAPIALRRRWRRRPRMVKTVVLSHFDGRCWDGNAYTDSYWKSFIDALRERDDDYLVVGVTCRNEHENRRQLVAQNDDIKVAAIELFCTPRDVIRALFMTITQTVRLPDSIEFQNRNIARVLQRQIENEQRDGLVFVNICHYLAFCRMLKDLQPTRIYHTFENHNWERLMALAAKQYAPDARRIGYQHATIPLSCLNHFPGRGETRYAPGPDVVLTTGPGPYRLLTSLGDFQPGSVKIGCALRYQYLWELELRRTPIRQPPVVGVALAIESDICVRQIQLVQQAVAGSNYKVVLKCHPATPASIIEAAFDEPLAESTTYFLGDDLVTFFDQIDLLVYSNSTVSFEAAMAGIPNIFLDAALGPASDPMFDAGEARWTASSGGELSNVINTIAALTAPELAARREQARNYVTSYFTPVSQDKLELFLTA